MSWVDLGQNAVFCGYALGLVNLLKCSTSVISKSLLLSEAELCKPRLQRYARAVPIIFVFANLPPLRCGAIFRGPISVYMFVNISLESQKGCSLRRQRRQREATVPPVKGSGAWKLKAVREALTTPHPL